MSGADGKRNRATATRIEEADIRIERIIWLAGERGDSQSDAFESFVQDHASEEVREVFPAIPAESFWDTQEATDVYFTLLEHKLFGFLVQVATPVRTYRNAKSWSSSWGHYSTKWLYAESLDEALAAGVAWAAERHEAARSSSGTSGEPR